MYEMYRSFYLLRGNISFSTLEYTKLHIGAIIIVNHTFAEPIFDSLVSISSRTEQYYNILC